MKLRRNAFYYFAALVFLLCVLLSMVCVFQRLGAGQEYPYLLKGAWIIAALALTALGLVVAALGARLGIGDRLRKYPRLCLLAEGLAVAILLLTGTLLRLLVIQRLPMSPESDYKTYYEMAVMLHRGTLLEDGMGYCDYVSMFPHVFGYPAVLSWVLGIFGESVTTALLFNLVLQIGAMILVWRIGRLAGGPVCGVISMALTALLPSAILYSNFVASEPLFTFLLYFGIWLFALVLKETEFSQRHPWVCVIELCLMGFVLAFASFVRPMAVIFLIAVIICLLPGEKRLPALPRNDIPLGLRAADKGWKRCLTVFAVYFAFSQLFTMATGYAVNRELAGSASYGYNLLVGLNLESYGGWNQDDAEYLYAALDATGSAQEAQMVSRDMALERLKVDPRALLNLFVHKFEVLWGNDDYGASWNILFLDQQGNLTPDRESLLYRMMDVSDLYYLFLLLGAGIYGITLFRRKPDTLYACMLLFCGTVALHLLVENQNRYHYHAIPLLALMTGTAVNSTARGVSQWVMAKIAEKKAALAEKAARRAKVEQQKAEEDERARLRAQALHAQFDMGKAIKEGHIRIVASESLLSDTSLPVKSPAEIMTEAAPEKAAEAVPAAPSAEPAEVQPETEQADVQTETEQVETQPEIEQVDVQPETEPVEDQTETEPVEDQTETEPVEDQTETEQAEDQPETEQAEALTETEPVEDHSETEQTEDQPETEQAEAQTETEPVEVQPETELANVQPEIEQVEAQTETEPANVQPETEPVEAQTETEPAEVLPEIEQAEAQTETEPAEALPEIEQVEAQTETEPVEDQTETEQAEVLPENEPVETQPESEPAEPQPETDLFETQPEMTEESFIGEAEETEIKKEKHKEKHKDKKDKKKDKKDKDKKDKDKKDKKDKDKPKDKEKKKEKDKDKKKKK